MYVGINLPTRYLQQNTVVLWCFCPIVMWGHHAPPIIPFGGPLSLSNRTAADAARQVAYRLKGKRTQLWVHWQPGREAVFGVHVITNYTPDIPHSRCWYPALHLSVLLVSAEHALTTVIPKKLSSAVEVTTHWAEPRRMRTLYSVFSPVFLMYLSCCLLLV